MSVSSELEMQRFFLLVVAVCVATCCGFVGKPGSRVIHALRAKQEIQDLNLEQMFDVFEKADKSAPSPKTSTPPPRPSSPKGAMSAAVPFLPKPVNLDGLVGNKGFDPIGFSDSLDVRWLREAELKHGRIAMLATVGWILTLFVNPVLGVGPVEAHNAAVASGAGAQVLTGIAALEFIGTVALKQTFDGKRAPGDFSFDPMNLYGKLDGKGKETMQLKELENGRLAMMAFSGLVTVAVALPDKAFPYF